MVAVQGASGKRGYAAVRKQVFANNPCLYRSARVFEDYGQSAFPGPPEQ